MELILLLVLSLDLARNDPRHGHGEDSAVDSEKENDPVVAVGSILDIPLLRPRVKGVAPPHRRSDFFVSQRGQSLSFVD